MLLILLTTSIYSTCNILICYLLVLFNGIGMAFYHGAEHIELYTAADPEGQQAPYPMFFRADLSEVSL